MTIEPGIYFIDSLLEAARADGRGRAIAWKRVAPLFHAAAREPALVEPARAAKVQALEQISSRLGISVADAIAVGDGANDLGMLARAGAGVALHAKPSVAAQCDLRVNHGDLTALLFLQGYTREEFVV